MTASTNRGLTLLMGNENITSCRDLLQQNDIALADVLAELDFQELLFQLSLYRITGRRGYPLKALLNAYVASFYLNLAHTNDLIRRLEADSGLRDLCGFAGRLPHRTTFNRFIKRMSSHNDLVELSLLRLTEKLKALLPDLGDEVAVDSTAVRSHSNPWRKTVSDPEARWGVKNSVKATKGKDGTEFFFGYKVHALADANYGIPLAQFVTPGNVNDNPHLRTLVEKGKQSYGWFSPKVVIADRGYDSGPNNDYLHGQEIIPIIHIRRAQKKSGKSKEGESLHEGIYTSDGVPTCIGMVPMEFVKTNNEGHHLYRCRAEACHLKELGSNLYRSCEDSYWQDPSENVRLFGGAVRRGSAEWKAIYTKRQSIERIFKSQKESRRLERHCVRGQKEITLHSLMSTLTFQATALVNLKTELRDTMRWMVKRVA